ncbi:conserved hypothetical protein [Neospora caninum Liverpool]|uniref:Guanylylate cyclase n=1 Tax=Neospora caninum (strain Liverpool) TaxID=572307 RepID=F0VDC3_NEOCL|nr:conserved hypothetical protein [Neospora caninum Liverpool]CBZ51638.1 conserved hypothetical protein [Neospora caninum Liverpool]CEL65592.1 TPA: hypothetical protein BN1204_014320 [Neospora caninum Liverpool]|eukprot:XP_003881671.1 conserved hypothetical protein [Neospora caninum Liverpool]
MAPRDGKCLEIEWIGQQNDNDCGLACVRMVLRILRRAELPAATGGWVSGARECSASLETPKNVLHAERTSVGAHEKAGVLKGQGVCAGAGADSLSETEEVGSFHESSAQKPAHRPSALRLSTQQVRPVPRQRTHLPAQRQVRRLTQDLSDPAHEDIPAEFAGLPSDATLAQRREEMCRLWQRLNDGAWTVDLFVLFLHMGLGAACLFATVCEGFNATHAHRPFYAEAEPEEQRRVERQFSLVRQAGGAVLNRSFSAVELREFLSADGVIICLVHRGILDAYVSVMKSRQVRSKQEARALRAHARRAAAAAGRLEYEGHFVVLVGFRKAAEPCSTSSSELLSSRTLSPIHRATRGSSTRRSAAAPNAHPSGGEGCVAAGARNPDVSETRAACRSQGIQTAQRYQLRHRHREAGDRELTTEAIQGEDGEDIDAEEWDYFLLDPAEPGTQIVDEEVLTLSRKAPGTDEDLLFVSTKGLLDVKRFHTVFSTA